jgi:hypothetical protein
MLLVPTSPVCQVTKQKILLDDTVEEQTSLEMEYSCEFTMTSDDAYAELNVSTLPKAFVQFINDNLSIMHSGLAKLGVLTVFRNNQSIATHKRHRNRINALFKSNTLVPIPRVMQMSPRFPACTFWK